LSRSLNANINTNQVCSRSRRGVVSAGLPTRFKLRRTCQTSNSRTPSTSPASSANAPKRMECRTTSTEPWDLLVAFDIHIIHCHDAGNYASGPSNRVYLTQRCCCQSTTADDFRLEDIRLLERCARHRPPQPAARVLPPETRI
jgi:hypothetical protein